MSLAHRGGDCVCVLRLRCLGDCYCCGGDCCDSVLHINGVLFILIRLSFRSSTAAPHHNRPRRPPQVPQQIHQHSERHAFDFRLQPNFSFKTLFNSIALPSHALVTRYLRLLQPLTLPAVPFCALHAVALAFATVDWMSTTALSGSR